MTDTRRPVPLRRDEVRGARDGADRGASLTFEMPFNGTSDRIREGGRVIFEGKLYEVTRREDLRPPIVAERKIEFSLKAIPEDV